MTVLDAAEDDMAPSGAEGTNAQQQEEEYEYVEERQRLSHISLLKLFSGKTRDPCLAWGWTALARRFVLLNATTPSLV